MDSVYQELKAIQHFVDCIQTRSKSFKAQDAHCLLIDRPQVKTYLQSQWKLSDLGDFFKKYRLYFKVDKDDTVSLRNPNLNVEEFKSVYFFVALLLKRQNRPFHITTAMNFVNTSGVESYLRTSYNIHYLTPFFENHRDFFLVLVDFISLKNYDGPAATGDEIKNTEVQKTIPKALNRIEKKYYKKMVKVGVNFYVDLIKIRQEISTKHAHSFLQDNSDLRDFLRDHYQLCHLAPFFKEHPNVFTVVGQVVHLTPACLASASSSSTPAPVTTVPTSVHSSFSQLFPKKYETIPVASQPIITQNTKPPGVKVLPLKQQDLSSQRNSNSFASSASTTQVNNPTGQVSKKVKNIHSNVSGNTNVTNLLSLVMSYSPQIGEPRTSSDVLSNISQRGECREAACQTLSTGPILSLGVLDEM